MTVRSGPPVRLFLPAAAGCLALLVGACSAPGSRPEAAPAPGQLAAESVPSEGGWIFPVAGAVLPARESRMPNAPRDYRGGTHEGVDIYDHADGTPLACGEEILNAQAGWIVRADHDWKPMVTREYEWLTAALKTQENPEYLDRLRGRQVWIRTADGRLVRYCHLSAIDEGVQVGLKVETGMRLAMVGNSGTYDGSQGSNRNCHLHFEVWATPDAFMGKGLPPKDALALYERLIGTGRK